MTDYKVLEERKNQTHKTGSVIKKIACEKPSLAGSVSQRACVFCGSRVVLYPISDALHVVHGPVGCASYTWDIRGSLSSGSQLNRHAFSTDLREEDVIFGGEPKLERTLRHLITRHKPRAAFVYSTCIVGVIGDDIEAVTKKLSKELNIPVLPVHSEGFKGTKKDGYHAACDALLKLIGTQAETVQKKTEPESPSINILGEFNLAGETWILKQYYQKMGLQVRTVLTGGSSVDEIRSADQAGLNLVQCSGSMTRLAQQMVKKYGIPFMRVSYFGIEDMADSLYRTASFFKDYPEIMQKTKQLIKEELESLLPSLDFYRSKLEGRRAAIYVGGAFKAISLVKALAHLGMDVVLVGSQTGGESDYEQLSKLCNPETIIVDDSNPVELASIIQSHPVDLFIGGVKERPMAYKLGIGFCDHNHERKIPLAGFIGMENFAKEVYETVSSPVWGLVKTNWRTP